MATQKLTAFNSIRNMGLRGYVAHQVNSHIKTWPPTILERNPNIIEAIALSNAGYGPEDSKYWPCKVFEYNETVGKHLTGLAFLYAATQDPIIKKAGDELTEKLHIAQGDKGYIGVRRDGHRLCDEPSWDIWGSYHAMYALAQWYRVTGDAKCLRMAIDCADYCLNHFKNKSYTVCDEFVNHAISHGYCVMYQFTGNERYLKEAIRIVEEEWPKRGDWMNNALSGKEFYSAPNDMNRWEALHPIMTLSSLYEITGEKRYLDALANTWHSITRTDLHNTGGFTSAEAACGNPYAPGAIETCSCVAWVGLGVEYLRQARQSYIADELELSYFNTILAALTESKREITYDTPMNGKIIKSQVPLDWLGTNGAPEINCCQANACRAMGEVSQWAVITDDQALYLNYYAPSSLTAKTPAGQDITLQVDSEYPRTGAIRIIVTGLPQKEAFLLKLRIPSWSTKNSIRVNGAERTGAIPGEYFTLEGEWQNGDEICIDLTLAMHYWVGEDRFMGKTSVYRGPILLALDTFITKRFIDDVTFDIADFEGMIVRDGEEDGCWIECDVKTISGDTITLIDFASVGRGDSDHITWLNVKHDLPTIQAGIHGRDIWLNGLK